VSATKVWEIHVVSPEEEKERLQWEGLAEKKGSLVDELQPSYNLLKVIK